MEARCSGALLIDEGALLINEGAGDFNIRRFLSYDSTLKLLQLCFWLQAKYLCFAVAVRGVMKCIERPSAHAPTHELLRVYVGGVHVYWNPMALWTSDFTFSFATVCALLVFSCCAIFGSPTHDQTNDHTCNLVEG